MNEWKKWDDEKPKPGEGFIVEWILQGIFYFVYFIHKTEGNVWDWNNNEYLYEINELNGLRWKYVD